MTLARILTMHKNPFNLPPVNVLTGHVQAVFCVAWSPDSTRIVSGANDNTVRLWSVRHAGSGGLQPTPANLVLEGHTRSVASVAWSPDGTQVASGSYDGSVRLWDVATGVCLRVLEGHTDSVESVAWSPDGTHLATGSEDKTVRLWDVASGACEHVLEGHTGWVWSVAFSPCGRQLASGSVDKTVCLWNVKDDCKSVFQPGPVQPHVLLGHTEAVACVAWSLDGAQIVSTSHSNNVLLWDVKSKGNDCTPGKLDDSRRFALQGGFRSADAVAYSPDRKQVAAGTHRGEISIWTVCKWRDKDHRLFSQEFKRLVFLLMCIKEKLRRDGGCRNGDSSGGCCGESGISGCGSYDGVSNLPILSHPPNLPMEMWLEVFAALAAI